MTIAHRDAPDFLHREAGMLSWLLSTDHKRVAWLYVIAITVFFFLGGISAAIFRLELVTPQGDLVSADTYNKLFTIHGISMVWFFLIPSIPATLGNFLVPIMIGARDLAFPRLNLLSWYIYVLGAAFTMAMVFAGGVDTGWTFYTPLSSLYSDSHVVLALIGVFVVGFSSILTALNIIVTVHTMRTPGMTWFRLPLFIWALYATSLILVLATPVLSMTLVLIALERVFGIGFFDPRLGGDPLLFQHLFWFYSHPAVYIMILPGMGVVSELVTCFARKRIFGYRFMAYSLLAIASVGFLVWGHHMFVAGQSMYGGLAFSILSMVVAIPSAIKTFNWLMTLYKGRISLTTPMLYALGFIGLFVLGGVTGLTLATIPLDVHLHDTYFVIAHFHYIMVGGMVMAYIGGIHFWWPKMTGRMYPETLGRVSAVFAFLGFNLTFFPQYFAGYLGMIRRAHEYAELYQPYQLASTLGAAVLGLAYLMPFFYLAWSAFFGRPAGDNPWDAVGLEWQTTSPPPTHNFTGQPKVGEAYDYDAKDRDRTDA